MPIQDFDTARLSVNRWNLAKGGLCARVEELSSILTPSVLAPLPASLQLGPGSDAIETWIADRLAESDMFAIRETDDGAMVGLLILAQFPGDAPNKPILHLGYLLAEAAWGKGYATELIKGLVIAVSHAGPATLLGGVAKDNPASSRVLIKAGFRVAADLSTTDTDTLKLTIG